MCKSMKFAICRIKREESSARQRNAFMNKVDCV